MLGGLASVGHPGTLTSAPKPANARSSYRGLDRGHGYPPSGTATTATSATSALGPARHGGSRIVRIPKLTGLLIAASLAIRSCSAGGTPSPGATAPPSQPALGLRAASSGVCQAIIALPDLSAAERAFSNLAHDALHGLAADPRLGRSMSARALEAMEKVEADFSRSPDVAVLTDDLTKLHASADAALRALGEEVPPCAE